MSTEEQDLLAQIARVKAKLASQGVDPDAVASTESPAELERAAFEAPTFTLEAVTRYLRRLEVMPLAALRAKFAQDLADVDVPDRWATWEEASKLWYMTVLVMRFQMHHYELHRGEVPRSIERRWWLLLHSAPWRPSAEVEDRVAEATKAFRRDDGIRLVATAENGFHQPKFTRYEVVRLAGAEGISFKALVAKYDGLRRLGTLPNTSSGPEDWAHEAFVYWPQDGIAKILYQEVKA